MTQMRWSRNPHCVQILKRLSENIFVEKDDGVESLMLGAGRDSPASCKSVKEMLDLFLTGQSFWQMLDNRDITLEPINIGVFSVQGFMLTANDFLELKD